MEVLTMLFSVVKSRLQAGHAGAARYRSALHGPRLIIAEEGFGGIYIQGRGLQDAPKRANCRYPVCQSKALL